MHFFIRPIEYVKKLIEGLNNLSQVSELTSRVSGFDSRLAPGSMLFNTTLVLFLLKYN